MPFWSEWGIKKIAKDIVLKNKDYIIKQLEEKWNNPETIAQLKQEFINLVSKDFLNTYQDSIDKKNEKIKKIEQEIKKFYDDLTTQIAEERSIYGKEVMENIRKYFDLLQQEEAEFDKFKVQLQALEEKINHIKKLLEDNQWQITDSLKQIKDIEKSYKDRINYLINKLERNFQSFEKKEREKFQEEIKQAYNEYIKILEEKVKQYEQDLKQSFEESKKIVEKNLAKDFSREKIQINKEKKEMLKELLYFDGLTFLKVVLILGFVLWIIFLDYSLMRDIIAQYFELDPYSDSPFKLFLYQYIVPFIFSGWIILWEIINDKVVKYHSKTTYWVLKILAYGAILWVILSVVLTADGISFEITQVPEVVIRVILFGISIPAAVILVDRYIWLTDILDFIKMTILLPIRIVFAPFVYIMYLFETRRIKKVKNETLDNLKNMQIDLNSKINIVPFKVKLEDFEEKMEDKWEIEYNPLFSTEMENNLNSILHTLNQIHSIINDLNTLSTKWTEIIKEKLNIIMKLLDEVDTRLNDKIKLFEKQYKPYIEDLKKQIKEIEKDLEKEEEDYRNMKKDIYEGVLEGLNAVI